MTLGNKHIIQAYESATNINGELNVGVPDGNYSTVNGWILEMLGRISKNGKELI